MMYPRFDITLLPTLPPRELRMPRVNVPNPPPMPDLSSVRVDGAKLRALRIQRDWKLDDVARAIGLPSRQRLSDIESCRLRAPDGDAILRLLLLYGVKPDEVAVSVPTSVTGERTRQDLTQKNLP